MGDDLQPGCLTDRLMTGLSQSQINPKLSERERMVIMIRGGENDAPHLATAITANARTGTQSTLQGNFKLIELLYYHSKCVPISRASAKAQV